MRTHHKHVLAITQCSDKANLIALIEFIRVLVYVVCYIKMDASTKYCIAGVFGKGK